MYTPGKMTFGAIAVAATLAFGGLASTPAAAETVNGKVGAAKSTAVSDTDVSSRRYRRYGYVRPFPPVYPYRYGYYRPRPYLYRPYYYASPYPYAYPYRPVYYRPYYAPGPFLGVGFGFGPRHYW